VLGEEVTRSLVARPSAAAGPSKAADIANMIRLSKNLGSAEAATAIRLSQHVMTACFVRA
jgi:hypothetical protein